MNLPQPFTIEAPAGHVFPQGFPNSSELYQKLQAEAGKALKQYPGTITLQGKPQSFDVSLYADLPLKTARQVHYTTFFIAQYALHYDWYEKATQYIEYHLASFGIFGGLYVWGLQQAMPTLEMPVFKANALWEFLMVKQGQQQAVQEREQQAANDAYLSWLELLPSIAPFGLLQKQPDEIPHLLKNGTVTNPYTQKQQAVIATEASLLEWFYALTHQLLIGVGNMRYICKEAMTDEYIEVIGIEGKQRMEEQHEAKQAFIEGKTSYTEALEVWIEQEQAYLSQIVPIMDAVHRHTPEPQFQEALASNDIDQIIQMMNKQLQSLHYKLHNNPPDLQQYLINYFLSHGIDSQATANNGYNRLGWMSFVGNQAYIFELHLHDGTEADTAQKAHQHIINYEMHNYAQNTRYQPSTYHLIGLGYNKEKMGIDSVAGSKLIQ